MYEPNTVRVMVTMWCDSEGDTSEGEGVIVMVRMMVTVVRVCLLGNNGNLRLLSALLTLLTQQSIHLLS